jgi:hypothetical protein
MVGRMRFRTGPEFGPEMLLSAPRILDLSRSRKPSRMSLTLAPGACPYLTMRWLYNKPSSGSLNLDGSRE